MTATKVREFKLGQDKAFRLIEKPKEHPYQYPYVFIGSDDFEPEIPIHLDLMGIGDTDTFSQIALQHGWRLVIGEECDCASRCDYHFFRTLQSAIAAYLDILRERQQIAEEDEGIKVFPPLYVKGFQFNDLRPEAF